MPYVICGFFYDFRYTDIKSTLTSTEHLLVWREKVSHGFYFRVLSLGFRSAVFPPSFTHNLMYDLTFCMNSDNFAQSVFEA